MSISNTPHFDGLTSEDFGLECRPNMLMADRFFPSASSWPTVEETDEGVYDLKVSELGEPVDADGDVEGGLGGDISVLAVPTRDGSPEAGVNGSLVA